MKVKKPAVPVTRVRAGYYPLNVAQAVHLQRQGYGAILAKEVNDTLNALDCAQKALWATRDAWRSTNDAWKL